VTSGTYGALFYTVIGAHALHVLVALAWLAATLVLVHRGRPPTAPPSPACALAGASRGALAGARLHYLL
jgi:heme/copper-type cytochrome/quinol oxidase subunit 3